MIPVGRLNQVSWQDGIMALRSEAWSTPDRLTRPGSADTAFVLMTDRPAFDDREVLVVQQLLREHLFIQAQVCLRRIS
jgi:hypothetical protein